jgi:hypothetical protein
MMSQTKALALLLLCGAGAYGQQKKQQPKKEELKSFSDLNVKAYYRDWAEGEVKTCSTWNTKQFHVLSCDVHADWEGSDGNLYLEFARQLIRARKPHEPMDVYEEVTAYQWRNGKSFTTTFPRDPWGKEQPYSDQTNSWSCRKRGEKIVCKDLGEIPK